MSRAVAAWRRVGRWVGRRWLGPATARRFAGFAARHVEEGTFFVIAVPRSLSLLEPCLKLVRERLPLALVVNGMEAAEEAALGRAFPEVQRFRLSTVPGTWWDHGAVLDLLSDGAERPFGLLDHDCYVMDPTVFGRLELGQRDLLAAPDVEGFFRLNEASGLRFPRTHFLYLNAPLVRAVRRRHGISCRKATKTPPGLRAPLAALGLGDHNFPPHPMPFWDTLQLVMAAGLADGYAWRWVPVEDGALVHFGAATRQKNAVRLTGG